MYSCPGPSQELCGFVRLVHKTAVEGGHFPPRGRSRCRRKKPGKSLAVNDGTFYLERLPLPVCSGFKWKRCRCSNPDLQNSSSACFSSARRFVTWRSPRLERGVCRYMQGRPISLRRGRRRRPRLRRVRSISYAWHTSKSRIPVRQARSPDGVFPESLRDRRKIPGCSAPLAGADGFQ